MSSIITIIIAIISYCPYYVFRFLLLLIQGDIKINPGLKKPHKYFSCPYWNVNSLVAHNMQKVSLFEEYNATHTYDLICFSEAYFDSSVESDDVSLRISGCKLFWTDHHSNTKIGSFCIYYKEPLALKTITFHTYSKVCFVKSYWIKSRDIFPLSIDLQVKIGQTSNIFFLFLNSYLSISATLNLTS